jgi:hypothetical protein
VSSVAPVQRANVVGPAGLAGGSRNPGAFVIPFQSYPRPGRSKVNPNNYQEG